MARSEETSLDRFLRNRGAQYLGQNMGRVGATIQLAIGGFFSAVGLGLLVAPLLGAPPQVAIGSIGCLGAGIPNGLVGLFLRRRLRQQQLQHVQLTPQARKLLLRLLRMRSDWRHQWQFAGSPGRGDGRHGDGMYGLSGASAFGLGGVQPLSAEVEDALERAAFEFNRVLGCLSTATGDPAFEKLGSRALAAADETMTEFLHHANQLADFPESESAPRAQAERAIGELAELADRAEQLAQVSARGTGVKAVRSAMEEVLDELRLEHLARAELSRPEERQQTQT